MNDFYLAIPVAETPSRPRCPMDMDFELKLHRRHLALSSQGGI